MPEYIYGNEVNVYIDGVLVGTQSIEEGGSIHAIIPKEYTSEEGYHLVSVDPVPVQEFKTPAKCEIKGTLKGRKYTDALKRVINSSGRKRDDIKENKLPAKYLKGWD